MRKVRPVTTVKPKVTTRARDTDYRVLAFDDMAKRFGWDFLDLQETNKMVSYSKDDNRLNVYYTTGTIGTVINHPKRGKTQLFRRNLTEKETEQLFKNPRTHTAKGYYTK